MADSVAVVVQVEAEEAPGVGEHHYEFLGDKEYGVIRGSYEYPMFEIK